MSLLSTSSRRVAAATRRLLALLLLGVLAPGWAQAVEFTTVRGLADLGAGYTRSWVDANNDGRDDYCYLIGSFLRCHFVLEDGDFDKTYTSFTIGEHVTENPYAWVDVNGDGRVDLCRLMTALGSGSSGTVQCRLGPGFSEAWSLVLPFWFEEIVCCDGARLASRPIDDSRSKSTSSHGPSNLASESVASTDGEGRPFRQGAQPMNSTYLPGLAALGDLYFVDVNGDAQSDVCYLHLDGFSAYSLRCHLAGPTGFGAVSTAYTADAFTYGNRDWTRGFFDFNGDGAPDFCRVVTGSQPKLQCRLGGFTGFATAEVTSPTLTTLGERKGAAFIDINGDGKTDFCRLFGANSDFAIYCRLSNGRSFEPTDIASGLLKQGSTNVSGHADQRWWVDINGDGLPDFCRAVGADPGILNTTDKSSNLWCRLGWASASLFAPDDLKIGENLTGGAINFGRGEGGRGFCDPWGTGVQTFCRVSTTTSTSTLPEVCLRNLSGIVLCVKPTVSDLGLMVGLTADEARRSPGDPDYGAQAEWPLLAAYSDGLGAETRLTYMPLSSPLVYARSGPGTGWPRVQVLQPRSSVVYETRAWTTGTNAVSLTGTARYFYKDLRADVQQGGRGFRERWMLTEGSNTIDHTVFFQGLGPAVDPGSTEHSPLEIGLVRQQRRLALDPLRFTTASGYGYANPRQEYLARVMKRATAAAAMPTAPTSPPTSAQPFLLLQLTENTIAAPTGNTRVRYVSDSTVRSWDWNDRSAIALPVVQTKTTMDSYGNVLTLDKTTTDGTLTWKQVTVSEFENVVSSTKWQLGRLKKSTVTSTAPGKSDQAARANAAYP